MRYEDASNAGAFQGSGPIANDDSDTLPAGSRQAATGNLITGEGTQYGASGADSATGGHITSIGGKGGEDSSFSGGKLSVSGEFGSLSVDADGNYSYLANKGAPENVRDRFTYTLADNQGNTDTAALVIELGKTPVVVKANAQQVVVGPDGVVTLPPGVELSDIMVVGRNLVVNLPDGSQMVIVDGAVFVPQLVLDGVEVPATNVAALLIGQEPQPAAGELPPSSGGNFALPPPPLDPGVPLGDLIPPTEYNYRPPEPREIIPLEDDEPEIFIQPDGQPATVNAVDNVEEAGLPTRNAGEPAGSGESADGNGADNDVTSETTSGNIIYSSEDTPNVITVNGVAIVSVGQIIAGSFGSLTITSIAPGVIGYSYTLTDNTSGNDTHDDFAVQLTDVDGDVASATLRIDIIDDVPTARPDTDALAVGQTVATGNVMTDAAPGDVGDSDTNAADTVGADNATVTSISGAGGSDNTFSAGVLVVNGQYGQLSMDAQGNYTYTRNADSPGGVTDVFNYTLTDGDGDASSTTLTITIPDATPNLPDPAAVLLDDDALANGNPGGEGDDVDSQGTPGNLLGTGGDGDLDYGFTGVNTLPAGFTTNLVNASTLQILQGGTVVLTITLDVETGAYSVVQNNPIDHPAGLEENNLSFGIGVEVRDVDGDAEPATLTINVDDDTPVMNRADVSLPSLLVDETNLAANDSDDFSVVFDGSFGADGAGSTSYAVSVVNGTDSGLVDVATGSPILLFNNAGVVEGRVGGADGAVAFTVSVNSASGVVTLDQVRAVEHPDTSNPDDPVSPVGTSIQLTATIVDGDQDSDSLTVNIGAALVFEDDGPSVSPTGAEPQLVVDESNLTVNDTKNFGDAFAEAFGADGPADSNSISYALGINAGDTGLVDTLSGEDVILVLNGGVVEGRTEVGGELVFTISVNSNGDVVVDQLRAVVHPDTTNPDDSISLANDNLITLTATVTDGDGDTASATIGIGSNVSLEDDGPSVNPSVISNVTVTVDESLPSTAPAIDTGAIVKGDDPDLAGGIALGQANSGVAIVDPSAAFGADGPAAGGGISYALTITNASSGLTLTDGSAINLQLVGGVIVGVVATGAFAGQAAFAIAIDSTTGVVSVEQYLSLDHPVTTDHNDPLQLGDATIGVTVTATDGDGDSVTSGAVDISEQITFLDDGPDAAVNGQAALDTLVLDETIPVGTETDGDSNPPGLATVTANFADNFVAPVNYGADGPGTTTYSLVLNGSNVLSGLYAVDPTDTTAGDGDGIGRGEQIVLNQSGNTITGSVGDDDYFTISIDPVTGVVTFTQLDNIWHANTGSDDDTSTLTAVVGSLLVRQTVVDGDGDSDTADVDVSVGVFQIEDDGPVAVNDSDTVGAPGSTATGNVITDAAPGDVGDSDNGADDVGADSPGRITAVASVNVPANTDLDPSANFTINGQYGQLVLNADGSYTYTRNAGTPGGVNDVFTYTLTDADGDSTTATLTIALGDAIPVAGTASAAVDDDGLGGANTSVNPNDIDANTFPNPDDLDGPASSEATFRGMLTVTGGDGDIDFSLVAPGAGITIGQETVTISGSGSLLTATITSSPDATRVGDTLFTVSLNHETGEYVVTLVDNVLHGDDANNDEDGSEVSVNIPFQVVDADGDASAANGTLTIVFNDDVPTATANQLTGTVDEDGVLEGAADNGPGDGIAGGPGDVAGENVSATGNVSTLFSAGADSPLSYVLLNSFAGLTAQNLTSGGVALSYSVGFAGGVYTLTATAGPGGNTVFTFTLNASTGAYNFTLIDQLDHAPGNGENELTINLSSIIQASDADGDTVNAGANALVITVDDDSPIATGTQLTGTVDEDGVVEDAAPGIQKGDGIAGGTGDVPGEVTVASGSVTTLFQSGADEPLAYSLLNNFAGLAAQNLTSGGVALSYTVGLAGGVYTLTATAGPGGNTVFTFTLNASTGAYQFTLVDQLDHALGNDENDLAINLSSIIQATDRDGDSIGAGANGLIITVDDDSPKINNYVPLQIDNDDTPSGTAAFDFDIGADENADNDDITVNNFTVLVNGQPVTESLIAGPETATTASYTFSFQYDTGTGGLATANGTLVFDKVAGTYTVTLDEPIEGFGILSTGSADASDFVSYQLPPNGTGAPEVTVAALDTDFFVQFSGVAEPGSGTGSNNLTTTQGAGGAFGSVTTANFDDLELFTQEMSTVQVSSSAAGVAGNTIQGGEVLDFNLYSTDPGGTLGGEPTANSTSMFIVLDGIGGSEDMIVVLKLLDTETGEYTTKALMVQNSDIITSNATLAGTPYEGIVLDNNDGIIVFEANDYQEGNENLVIVGAQIAGSDEGITGDALAFNGALDTAGVGTESFATDVSDAPFKITSIGFLTTSTDDQNAQIDFDVTIEDFDGDAVTQHITVNIGETSGTLSTLAATSFAAEEEQIQKSAANSNTLTMAAAVAAAGVAESVAASEPAPSDSDLSGSDELVASYSATTVEKISVDDDAGTSSVSMLGSEPVSDDSASAKSSISSSSDQSATSNGLGDGSANAASQSDDHSSAAAEAPAPAADVSPVAPTVAMVSAEAIEAASVSDTAKSGGSVEQILAEALGHGNAPSVDELLAHLPGGGNGELPGLAHMASPDNAAVSGWDMAGHGAVGAGFDMLFKADVAIHHQDAVQPTANG